jgi:hypothetical protein
MSAVRLPALYKTAERTLEATRPVACGESERRAVGSAMVAVAKGRIEDLFLSFNQFMTTARISLAETERIIFAVDFMISLWYRYIV